MKDFVNVKIYMLIGIIVFITAVTLLFWVPNKVYAYTENQYESIEDMIRSIGFIGIIPDDIYDTYIVAYRIVSDGDEYVEICHSSTEIVIGKSGTGSNQALRLQTVDNSMNLDFRDFGSGDVTFRDLGYSYSANVSNYFSNIADAVLKVEYSNHDLYYGSNLMFSNYFSVPTPSPEPTPTPVPSFTYEYDSAIPNVAGASVERKYLFKLGKIYIGLSDTEYYLKWLPPDDNDLKMEIDVTSQRGSDINDVKRYHGQTVYKPVLDGDFVTPDMGKLYFDINVMGRYLYLHAWGGTELLKQAIPREIYVRYAKISDQDEKIYYGNWTRIYLNFTGQGIMGNVIETVTSDITEDSEGNIIDYVDTPTEDNFPEYRDYNGNIVTEDESYSAYENGIKSTLDNSVSTLNNVSSWVGQVPDLIGSLFTFIPKEVIAFIGLSFIALMVLKIAGR